jgi:acyl-CoA synthetase (NDP forming)
MTIPAPDNLKDIDALFHPQSLAIIGLPQGMKTGKLFLIALQDMGFSGPIYPVNPKADEIDGLTCYRSLTDVPGSVDLAIVLVPTQSVLDVAKECAEKGVKGAVLFTSGGKELGTDEGRHTEAALIEIARTSGMRILGPNCMGLYAPRSGLSFFPGMSQEPGGVGLISHSGSLSNILGRMADEKAISFSKVVSLGNECDLNAADFLAYLAKDDETRVIGAYLENIKDGPLFLRSLQEASKNKPVLLWKVGLTPEGGRAAASHTGALAGSAEIWQGVVRQGGAISIVGFEQWVDYLMGFSMLTQDLGDRMAVISGPGGLAVGAAEACGANGLKLADLSPETVEKLSAFIPPTGTSLRNPIDVSLTASLEIDMYIESARLAAADPNVDAIVVAGCGLSDETNEKYTNGMIGAQKEFNKPFLMVNIPGFDPALAARFCKAGVPFFDSSERALDCYAQVKRYQAWRNSRQGI